MDNKVAAVFDGKLRAYRTKPRYQYDYGLNLQISGIALPQAYEVHYSNRPNAANTITQIGDAEGAAIPDELLQTGETVYAWLYLHTGESDGVTVLSIIIPVIRRARPTNDEPTPVQQDAITEAIAALNTAVTQTAQDAADAEAAKGAAEAAAHSAQENADAASQAARYADSAGSVAATAAAQASAAQGAAAGNAQRAETAAAAAVRAESSAQVYAANAAESAASASRHNASADDFRRQAELSAQRAAQSAETAKACGQSASEDALTATAAATKAQAAAQTAAETAQACVEGARAAVEAVANSLEDELSDIDNKRQIYERDAVGILNIADGLTWYEDRAIDQHGEYVDNSNFRASDQIAVPEAAYKIKYANVEGCTIGLAKYDADDNFVAVRLLTSTEQGIATWAIDTSDCSYIRVYIHKQMHVLSILPNVGTLNAKVSDLAALVAGLPKIQYGTGTTASSTGILDVEFDTPFSEAPVVIITPRSGTNSDVANTARLVSVTARGFRCIAVSVYKPSGSQTVTTRPDPNRDIHWVAIGT